MDRELFFYLFFHSTESAYCFTPQKEYGLLKTDFSLNSGWHRAWIQPRRITELSEDVLSGKCLEVLINYSEGTLEGTAVEQTSQQGK